MLFFPLFWLTVWQNIDKMWTLGGVIVWFWQFFLLLKRPWPISFSLIRRLHSHFCILLCWKLFAEYGCCYRCMWKQKLVVDLLNWNCSTTETPATDRAHTNLCFPIWRIVNQLPTCSNKTVYSLPRPGVKGQNINSWAIFTILWEKEAVICSVYTKL